MLNTLSNAEMQETGTSELERRKPEEFRRMRNWIAERIAQGAKKPFSEVVTLTPVLANLLLERNPKNRPLSKTGILELMQDVANGRFVFNGQPVIVSDTGILNDGQHRCQVVVQTGVSIETTIVFGPKEETRFTVDTGKSKTVSNFLAMKGRTYTHVLGAAVGYYLQWKRHGGIRHDGMTRPTKQEILTAADELKGIDTSVEFTVPSMKTVRSHAVLAFCHYAFWKRSGRAEADHFITRLIDGEGLRKGDPILYCRNRLIGMGRGPYAQNRAELIFKCWNAYRLGHGIDHCKLNGKLPKLER